ncbi:MAG: Zn-dependent protease, partial [Starkeya sp.]|nr:Zn-dependent protease [Starkeya sp.]
MVPRALLLAAALFVAGCAAVDDKQASAPSAISRDDALTPAQRKEHERLVASYGGAYNDPKLQKQIEVVVARLVAASERPDLHYRVTILNSPAVNAFALPNGSLYVTRGLLALSSDNAELASVLAHEMAHVIANHAATREDQ